MDGKYICIGKEENQTTMGTIEAIGDSIEECKDKLREYSKLVSGIDVSVDLSIIDRIDEVVENAEKLGIYFE